MLITSPKSVATHAHQSVLVSSGFSADMQALMSMNVAAGGTTFLGAGYATTLMGGKRLKAISSFETEISSRLGEIKLEAPTILIGSLSTDRPQRPTKEIVLDAQDNARMRADHASVVGRKNAVVDGHKTVDVKSEGSITIGAPSVQVSNAKTVSIVATDKFDAVSGKSRLSAEPDRIVMSVGDGAPKPVSKDEFYNSQHWSGYNEFLNA